MATKRKRTDAEGIAYWVGEASSVKVTKYGLQKNQIEEAREAVKNGADIEQEAMTKSLGQLSSVAVRSLWPNEAADFTPWLAREENMSRLGEALGLELEAEQIEVAVGP